MASKTELKECAGGCGRSLLVVRITDRPLRCLQCTVVVEHELQAKFFYPAHPGHEKNPKRRREKTS